MTHLVHRMNINVWTGKQHLEHLYSALKSGSHQRGVPVLHRGCRRRVGGCIAIRNRDDVDGRVRGGWVGVRSGWVLSSPKAFGFQSERPFHSYSYYFHKALLIVGVIQNQI